MNQPENNPNTQISEKKLSDLFNIKEDIQKLKEVCTNVSLSVGLLILMNIIAINVSYSQDNTPFPEED